MIHTYKGESINAQPPISNVSVNKFSVSFRDQQKLKNVVFQNVTETKSFVNWLVNI